jgi:hypothetical protein
MAGVAPSLAAFLLLLIGALLGAAAGAGLMWWRHRRQLRYLQPASPRQAYAARYAASPQVGALVQLLPPYPVTASRRALCAAPGRAQPPLPAVSTRDMLCSSCTAAFADMSKVAVARARSARAACRSRSPAPTASL